MSLVEFARKRSPARPALPLAAAVARIEQFQLPAKPPALVEAEASRQAASEEREAIREALKPRYADIRARQVGEVVRTPAPTDVAELEARLRATENALGIAREAVRKESEPWRHEVLRVVAAEIAPARAALHDLVAEIDAAMQAFARLADLAYQHDTGSQWILREAPLILHHLRTLRAVLATDAQLRAAE